MAVDQRLYEGCLRGESRAWETLLRQVEPLVHIIARRDFALCAEDADDIQQLVAMKLFENLAQLRDRAAFKQWLRCLVRRVILDYLRYRKEPASLDYLQETFGLEPFEALTDDRWVEHSTLRVEVHRALTELPERYRGPLLLHVLQGEPQDEVSRILGRPRSTVASQISRGLRRLRRSLAAVEFA